MTKGEEDMQSLYCRMLSGAIRYNDLCIDYMNSLVKFYPVPVRSLTGRLLDNLYESRDALIENRENLHRIEQLFCSLD
ncbi:MAG: hypothetical protein M0R06_13120 [Sphaerochaeta sp.]|jgi:hypothetical protein|nr:hypothetical protein [Sphaerochaeta sp.]